VGYFSEGARLPRRKRHNGVKAQGRNGKRQHTTYFKNHGNMRKIKLLTASVKNEDGLYVGIINEVKGIVSAGETLSELKAQLLIAYRLHMEVLEGDLQFKLIVKQKELIKLYEDSLCNSASFLAIHGQKNDKNFALGEKLRSKIIELEELLKT
jgi:predicted RNase H-like HicB family nuclease